jgi:hypothetical protein
VTFSVSFCCSELVALLVEDVGLGQARALQELLEVPGILEGLLDRRVDLLLDFLVGDLDVLLVGLLLDPVAADEELEDLVAERVVLLLALALELRLGRLRLALRRRRGGRLLVGNALREVRAGRGSAPSECSCCFGLACPAWDTAAICIQ